MAHVDLCSGLGGFGYGFETVGLSKPVLFCEIDPWCRKVLKKHWPDVPQCEDVKELADDPDRYVPRNLDWSNTILTAGFPCQPWSISGRSRNLQEAKSDPRHIWPWIVEVVEQKRPTICIFENVPHLASLGGLDEVIVDLANANYATTTFNISAIAGSGAPRAASGGPGKNPNNKRGMHQGNPLATAVAMWPTPTTRDHKGGYKGGRIRNGKVSMDSLDVAVQHTDNQKKESKQLNPEWVTWLQGYPRGWTDLESTTDLK